MGREKTKVKSERQIRAVDKHLMRVANMNVKYWKIRMIDDLWIEDFIWSLNIGNGKLWMKFAGHFVGKS